MAEEYVSKDQFGEFVRRMEAGFHALEQRFDALDRRIDDSRREVLGRMDVGFHAVDQRFDALKERFDALDRRVSEVRQDLTGRTDSLDRRLHSVENWIRATFVTIIVLGCGVVAQLVFFLLRGGVRGPTP